MNMDPTIDQITEILCRIGKLSHVEPDQDYYAAGLASMDALQLLVELEGVFGVSISDDAFVLARTPRALQTLLSSLR